MGQAETSAQAKLNQIPSVWSLSHVQKILLLPRVWCDNREPWETSWTSSLQRHRSWQSQSQECFSNKIYLQLYLDIPSKTWHWPLVWNKTHLCLMQLSDGIYQGLAPCISIGTQCTCWCPCSFKFFFFNLLALKYTVRFGVVRWCKRRVLLSSDSFC